LDLRWLAHDSVDKIFVGSAVGWLGINARPSFLIFFLDCHPVGEPEEVVNKPRKPISYNVFRFSDMATVLIGFTWSPHLLMPDGNTKTYAFHRLIQIPSPIASNPSSPTRIISQSMSLSAIGDRLNAASQSQSMADPGNPSACP
jgi:hypothetical protein